MLARLLAPRTEAIYAALRLVSGLAFGFHGVQKVLGVFGGTRPAALTQLWLGGWIELLTGALIAAGAFTRGAAFLASGTMAVAYTQFHWKLELGSRLLPGVNKGELALVYAFLFLYVAARGGGPYSVDGRRAGRR